MSELLVYRDLSEVRAGKLEQLKAAMKELVELVEAAEPRIVSYNVYFTEDGTRMTVLHIHQNPASLDHHMKVAGPAFPKFAEFINLVSIDIYGRPSEQALVQLRQKARNLGSGTVTVHELHAGIAHLDPSQADRPGSPFGAP